MVRFSCCQGISFRTSPSYLRISFAISGFLQQTILPFSTTLERAGCYRATCDHGDIIFSPVIAGRGGFYRIGLAPSIKRGWKTRMEGPGGVHHLSVLNDIPESVALPSSRASFTGFKFAQRQ